MTHAAGFMPGALIAVSNAPLQPGGQNISAIWRLPSEAISNPSR